MTILDRYILKHFVVNFIILFVVLFLFSCMVQLFVNMDRFVEAIDLIEGSESFTRWERLKTVVWMVIDFYGPQTAQFFTYLAGMVTVGAMGFTLVQLHRNRELIALLAAGVSLHRIVMSIIVVGLLISVLQFANRELVLPHLGPRLLRDYGELGQSELKGFSVLMARDSAGHLFYAHQYHSEQETMERVAIWQQSPDGKTLWRVTADSATWDGDGWSLENGVFVRSVGEDDFRSAGSEQVSEPFSNDPTFVSESDDQGRSGRLTPLPVSHIESNLDPTAVLLRRFGEYRQMLNLNQIGELIRRPGGYDVNDLIRIRYGRFSQVLINVLTLLIALPFFMLREPKNLLTQTVACAMIGITAQVGGAVGVAVGFPGVPAAASAFMIPLLVLLPLAVAMMGRVRT